MTNNILSEGFTHLFQDRLYLESMTSGVQDTIVGGPGNYGRRIVYGPVCVEYYTCDKEPELLPFRGLRLVIWTPVTRTNRPEHWIQTFKKSTRQVSAYIDIRNIDEYYKTWSKIFRNYYYHFAKQNEYVIESISCDEFCNLYNQYGKDKATRSMSLPQLQNLDNNNQEMTHFYILINTAVNQIVAGVAVVDCPPVDQSYYVAAFTRKIIAPKEAGLWLLQYWMKESSKRGIAYANFGAIWTPGQPKSWKGFSDFKMKFNPQLLVLKPELVRFTFSLRS